jgi:hypothetical protein
VRKLSVGQQQERGDPPAFHTKSHRVQWIEDKPITTPSQRWSAAFWTLTFLAVVAACVYVLIRYLRTLPELPI